MELVQPSREPELLVKLDSMQYFGFSLLVSDQISADGDHSGKVSHSWLTQFRSLNTHMGIYINDGRAVMSSYRCQGTNFICDNS